MNNPFGVTEHFCHTSTEILRFSISRYQNNQKTTVIAILFEESLRCDGAFLSHVHRNIQYFDISERVSETQSLLKVSKRFRKFQRFLEFQRISERLRESQNRRESQEVSESQRPSERFRESQRVSITL